MKFTKKDLNNLIKEAVKASLYDVNETDNLYAVIDAVTNRIVSAYDPKKPYEIEWTDIPEYDSDDDNIISTNEIRIFTSKKRAAIVAKDALRLAGPEYNKYDIYVTTLRRQVVYHVVDRMYVTKDTRIKDV